MLPPLLLQLEAHHRVADLCAAPGSKTTLVLDIMHRRARHQHQLKQQARMLRTKDDDADDDDPNYSSGGNASPPAPRPSLPPSSPSAPTTPTAQSTMIMPTGMVVANDADGKRCRLLLSKRVRQVLTPCAAISVGNGQSVPFPEGYFDRVLADVRTCVCACVHALAIALGGWANVWACLCLFATWLTEIPPHHHHHHTTLSLIHI